MQRINVHQFASQNYPILPTHQSNPSKFIFALTQMSPLLSNVTYLQIYNVIHKI